MQVDNIKKIKEFLEEQKTLLDFIQGDNLGWKSSGLLYGIDDVSAELLITKLNEIVKILLTSNIAFDKRLESLMPSIVVMAFKFYGHLVNNCLAAVVHVNSKIENLPTEWDYNNIDIEAQFCNLMAEEIARLKL